MSTALEVVAGGKLYQVSVPAVPSRSTTATAAVSLRRCRHLMPPLGAVSLRCHLMPSLLSRCGDVTSCRRRCRCCLLALLSPRPDDAPNKQIDMFALTIPPPV